MSALQGSAGQDMSPRDRDDRPDQRRREPDPGEDWIDRALRDLGDQLLEDDIPERLARIIRERRERERRRKDTAS